VEHLIAVTLVDEVDGLDDIETVLITMPWHMFSSSSLDFFGWAAF
jgi:hypothetical protein